MFSFHRNQANSEYLSGESLKSICGYPVGMERLN